ncbi:PREDICTED: thrombomodulin [Crocodylus porosus]|uniref:Thrombomodulin n=1 Tax=Crocodylus porosus TaxID=8502 RepID=A0A7M4EWY1_CROPO|nr:PREDICTED: thrombomodulin [Crocodylus porosus]
MLAVLVVLGAALARGLGAPVAGAQCVEHDCFSLHWARGGFASARRGCEERGGHLMTVRSTVAADVLELLLQNSSAAARLWLGLHLPRDCTEPGPRLRGFRWVTGDADTDYVNWRRNGSVCGRACAAVSRDLLWEERRCHDSLDGFLCEYNYLGTCRGLSGGDVTYRTPFGARDSDLVALPPDTEAWLPALNLQLVCKEDGGLFRWSAHLPGAWACQVENGGCKGTCQEKDGHPSCTCPEGRKLEADARSCSAPCASAPCEQLCVPHGTDLICMCHEGYELTEDGIHCKDIDDCQVNPQVCDQICINTEGGFQCQCHEGYELVEGKCRDVLECYEVSCQHHCEDVPGGYRCVCFEGYAPDPKNPLKCVSFCNQSQCPAECDPHVQSNCMCPDGFILDESETGPKMCIDINECEMQHCDGICTNTLGSFRCDCPEGQVLTDPYTCVNRSDFETEISGSGEIYPQTPVPTQLPPAKSLHPGALVGIIVGTLSMIIILIALVYHLMKKNFIAQRAMDYKCSSSIEKEVGLYHVTPGCSSAGQKL